MAAGGMAAGLGRRAPAAAPPERRVATGPRLCGERAGAPRADDRTPVRVAAAARPRTRALAPGAAIGASGALALGDAVARRTSSSVRRAWRQRPPAATSPPAGRRPRLGGLGRRGWDTGAGPGMAAARRGQRRRRDDGGAGPVGPVGFSGIRPGDRASGPRAAARRSRASTARAAVRAPAARRGPPAVGPPAGPAEELGAPRSTAPCPRSPSPVRAPSRRAGPDGASRPGGWRCRRGVAPPSPPPHPTTLVSWTASSSPLVKPVNRLPFTISWPWNWTRWSAPGAWQTAATGLPASENAPMRAMECGSSAKSHIGPWPPG